MGLRRLKSIFRKTFDVVGFDAIQQDRAESPGAGSHVGHISARAATAADKHFGSQLVASPSIDDQRLSPTIAINPSITFKYPITCGPVRKGRLPPRSLYLVRDRQQCLVSPNTSSSYLSLPDLCRTIWHCTSHCAHKSDPILSTFYSPIYRRY